MAFTTKDAFEDVTTGSLLLNITILLGAAIKQNSQKLTVQEMVQRPLPQLNHSLEKKDPNKTSDQSFQ